METSPPTPEAKPPLSRAFFITLLAPIAPIASMAVAAACSALGGRNSNVQGFGMLLSLATLVALLVCSIVCAVMVGKRSGGGIGVLTFLAIQVIYVAVAFAGCAATTAKLNFH